MLNSEPVLVYPTHVDAEPSDRSAEDSSDAGTYYRDGQRVTWRYTADMPEDDCAYCQDGRCEQRVETCGAWKHDIVIHDRPRWTQ